jgi:uncharacterized membrane protein
MRGRCKDNPLVYKNALHRLWLRCEPFLFPIVPRSPERFVHFLFWHSLLLTASTPLARIVRGQWMGVFTIESILFLFGLATRPGTRYPDTYLIYPQYAALDRGFSQHAFFGLLWLSMAFVQMAILARRHERAHKVFGYVIQVAFIGHLASAVSLLLTNTEQHPWVTKLVLLSPVTLSATFMLLGIGSIRRGEVSRHVDRMFRCFVYSIEGAGTIRTVGYMLWLAHAGPTFCQSEHGATSNHCVSSYVLRLFLARLLSLYWLGCYARMRANPDFTRSLLREVSLTAVACSGCYCYVLLFLK